MRVDALNLRQQQKVHGGGSALSRTPEFFETSLLTTPPIKIMGAATYYEILALPAALRTCAIPPQTLRTAYRRALLQNHPDKSSSKTVLSGKHGKSGEGKVYSIDEISLAFAVLGDLKAKAEYDTSILRNAASGKAKEEEFRTGVEVVDLDDLVFVADNTAEGDVDGEGIWYRSCRCGDERGFEVREEDLEEAVGEGEVSVGCKGCSLWLRVLFGVLEEG